MILKCSLCGPLLIFYLLFHYKLPFHHSKLLFHFSSLNLKHKDNKNKKEVDFKDYDKKVVEKLNINMNYINQTNKTLQQFEDIEYNLGNYEIYPVDQFKQKEKIDYDFTEYSIDSNIKFLYDNNLH
jgi:hypothetical protein